MFSLQKLLSKEDTLCILLEASAEEARTSVQALLKLSKTLEPLRVIALEGLFELPEKVVDRCRDAGNVVAHVVLKNF